MSRLPTEGEPGTNMDDFHCLAAFQHSLNADPDATPTAAELQRIERGKELALIEEFT
jgi:hypothetical protein